MLVSVGNGVLAAGLAAGFFVGHRGVAALISGLFVLLSWPMPLLGVVAVGFGAAALWTRDRRRLRATALAVPALVFCPAWLGYQLLIGAPLFGPGGSELSTLDVGECYNRTTDPDYRTSPRVLPVPCTGPYEGQVYATFQLTGSSNSPGSAALHRQADELCAKWRADHRQWLGTPVTGVPSDRRWSTDGKRRATCAVEWLHREVVGP